MRKPRQEVKYLSQVVNPVPGRDSNQAFWL